jgi:RNA polymerase sigma factor (sigma-70 family)
MPHESPEISEEEFCAAFEVLAASRHIGGPLSDAVRAALAVVYRYAAPRLASLLRARFKVAADVIADVISTLFVRLVTRGVSQGGDPIRSPMAWLTRMAYNGMEDALRARDRDRPLSGAAAGGPSTPGPQTRTGLPADVEECLEWLSEREREVVQLWYAGFSGDEVAHVLATTANTIYVTFSRAKARLRQCLGTPA